MAHFPSQIPVGLSPPFQPFQPEERVTPIQKATVNLSRGSFDFFCLGEVWCFESWMLPFGIVFGCCCCYLGWLVGLLGRFFPLLEAYLHPQSTEDFHDKILHSVGFNVSISVFREEVCQHHHHHHHQHHHHHAPWNSPGIQNRMLPRHKQKKETTPQQPLHRPRLRRWPYCIGDFFLSNHRVSHCLEASAFLETNMTTRKSQLPCDFLMLRKGSEQLVV